MIPSSYTATLASFLHITWLKSHSSFIFLFTFQKFEVIKMPNNLKLLLQIYKYLEYTAPPGTLRQQRSYGGQTSNLYSFIYICNNL